MGCMKGEFKECPKEVPTDVSHGLFWSVYSDPRMNPAIYMAEGTTKVSYLRDTAIFPCSFLRDALIYFYKNLACVFD